MRQTNLPTARQVRDVLGQVEVGDCLIGYQTASQAFTRFPWRVYGPKNADDERELLDEFARYRTATRYAKAISEGRPVNDIDD